jgi:hypothetical protein
VIETPNSVLVSPGAAMVDWLVHHLAHRSIVYRFHGYAISNLYSYQRDQHLDLMARPEIPLLPSTLAWSMDSRLMPTSAIGELIQFLLSMALLSMAGLLAGTAVSWRQAGNNSGSTGTKITRVVLQTISNGQRSSYRTSLPGPSLQSITFAWLCP